MLILLFLDLLTLGIIYGLRQALEKRKISLSFIFVFPLPVVVQFAALTLRWTLGWALYLLYCC